MYVARGRGGLLGPCRLPPSATGCLSRRVSLWRCILAMGMVCMATTLLITWEPQPAIDLGELEMTNDFGFQPAHGGLDPQRHMRLLAALDTLPQRDQLQLVQREILRVPRPPDSFYNINVTLSDSISLERSIEDTRPPPCHSKDYDVTTLPRASVVIPFYNEALSMLLRTVHSVLNRSPDGLLEEIILVDDNSTHANLKQPLARYLRLLPKVTLLRNSQREGLIRSRLKGAELSRAPVIVFLDAHTEANVGWLEPLLDYLHRHPTAIVQPFVDGIDIVNMLYSQPSTIHRGGFTWDLRYVWIRMPEYMQRAAMDEGEPFSTPTMIGCAIAVHKAHFTALGAFDTHQDIWGGENIELSFRAWLCGGSVVTVPCSRVGHVFRPLPYRDEADWQQAWQRNLMRVADVWLGDFRKYFYSSTRVYEAKRIDYTAEERQSLEERIKLRTRLKCKKFDWYLNFIIPEMPIPPHNALYHGEVSNYKSQACWEVQDDMYIGITYGCYEHKIIPENVFSITSDGLLLYKNRCVRFLFPKPHMRIEDCPKTPDLAIGLWSVEFAPGQMRWAQIKVRLEHGGHVFTWCVMQVTSALDPHRGRQMAETADCDPENRFQYWSFTYRFDYVDDFISTKITQRISPVIL